MAAQKKKEQGKRTHDKTKDFQDGHMGLGLMLWARE